jgi:hypothetical protein
MRMHRAEVRMNRKPSAGTRRRYIEYIVNRHTGVNNPNWWGPLDLDNVDYPEQAVAYRKWALARAPSLRTELEAMSDEALLAEYDRCNETPECLTFSLENLQQQEQQDEVERTRQYHRNMTRAGGFAHRSAKQPPEITEACKCMYASNRKIAAKQGYDKLMSKDGYRMPDGRVIRFKGELAFETFRTRYWPKRKMLQ